MRSVEDRLKAAQISVRLVSRHAHTSSITRLNYCLDLPIHSTMPGSLMSSSVHRRIGCWLAVCATLLAFVPTYSASAAVLEQVQSGTAVNSANGIQTISISSVDMTKSVLIFQTRSNSNRPVGSLV